jgi:hypothetical protein
MSVTRHADLDCGRLSARPAPRRQRPSRHDLAEVNDSAVVADNERDVGAIDIIAPFRDSRLIGAI